MTALRRGVDGLAVIVFIACLSASAQALLVGCQELQPRTPDQALLVEAAAHQAELTACLEKAKRNTGLYSEWKACQLEVDQRYGIAAKPELP